MRKNNIHTATLAIIGRVIYISSTFMDMYILCFSSQSIESIERELLTQRLPVCLIRFKKTLSSGYDIPSNHIEISQQITTVTEVSTPHLTVFL